MSLSKRWLDRRSLAQGESPRMIYIRPRKTNRATLLSWLIHINYVSDKTGTMARGFLTLMRRKQMWFLGRPRDHDACWDGFNPHKRRPGVIIQELCVWQADWRTLGTLVMNSTALHTAHALMRDARHMLPYGPRVTWSYDLRDSLTSPHETFMGWILCNAQIYIENCVDYWGVLTFLWLL